MTYNITADKAQLLCPNCKAGLCGDISIQEGVWYHQMCAFKLMLPDSRPNGFVRYPYLALA